MSSALARHLLALLLGLGAAPALAQVDIAVEVTPAGEGLFHYAYSLTNLGSADVAIVSIAVPPDPLAIDNLMAPAGFLASFDPGLGFLDFVEATQSFEPAVGVSGFSFDSPFGPGSAGYTALDANGLMFSGNTTAPVPEPTSALSLAACLTLLVYGRGRTRPREH
ncbi:MAG: hypothetical protein AMXMBFR13_24400 [Phycisphaerae bacterium]